MRWRGALRAAAVLFLTLGSAAFGAGASDTRTPAPPLTSTAVIPPAERPAPDPPGTPLPGDITAGDLAGRIGAAWPAVRTYGAIQTARPVYPIASPAPFVRIFVVTLMATCLVLVAVALRAAPIPPHGISSPAGTPAAPGTVAIVIDRVAYQPYRIEVAPGTRVMWTNRDGPPHTVTVPGDFDSGRISTGGTFARTFEEPGSSPDECFYQQNMTGRVVVAGPTASPGASPLP